MRRHRRYLPNLESLEPVRLLATQASFAGFGQYVVKDDADPTGHTAYGFPGMQYRVDVSLPAGAYVFQNVKISFSASNLYNDPTAISTTDPPGNNTTSYTASKGQFSLIDWWNVAFSTTTHREDQVESFGCPKDPGTFMIGIDATCWLPPSYPGMQPTQTADFTDTLFMEVDPVKVNYFVVADPSSDPGSSNGTVMVNASGLWFGRASAVSNTLVVDPSGPYLAFMMAGGSPNARKYAGLFASVDNETKYDLNLGFIQIVSFNWSRVYTSGATAAVGATDDLDVAANAAGFLYGSVQYKAGAGTTRLIPGPAPEAPVSDSPTLGAPAQDTSRGTGWLKNLVMQDNFSTSLVVNGGSISPTIPEPGYPIALSTAQWHLVGSATNSFVASNPSLANALNMANWQASMSSGDGLWDQTQPLPGPNTGWTADGDNASKYLTWNGNAGVDKAPWDASSLGIDDLESPWLGAMIVDPRPVPGLSALLVPIPFGPSALDLQASGQAPTPHRKPWAISLG